jgi:serine/threonine protein kinase
VILDVVEAERVSILEAVPAEEGSGIVRFLASAGRSQVLRCVLEAAEGVRQIHDDGRVHGAISPAAFELVGPTVRLLAAPSARTVTPYTAPEVLQGHAPDSRSDIFALGAVFYEVFTGRRAFESDGTETLAAAALKPSGMAATDRLLCTCLAKDPAARWQRMQQVITELKLLMIAEHPQAWPRDTRDRLGTKLRGLAKRVDTLEQRLAAVEMEAGSGVPGDPRDQFDPAGARHNTAPFWFPGRSGRGWRPTP